MTSDNGLHRQIYATLSLRPQPCRPFSILRRLNVLANIAGGFRIGEMVHESQ